MSATPRTAASGFETAPDRAHVLPALEWRVGFLLTFFTTALLLLSEIDRLSGQVASPVDGRIHPFNELVGPRATVEGWNAVLTNVANGLGPMLVTHVVLDTLFVAGYAWLGWWLAQRSQVALGRALLVTAMVDLVENALIMTSIVRPLVVALVVVTFLKWLMIVFTAFLGIRAVQRGWARFVGWAGIARFALRIQRFGALVLAVLVLLSLVPRDGVFDQLPDVQRAWPESTSGWLQFAAAVGVLLVIAAALFILGRLRTQHLLDEQDRGPVAREPYPLLLWFVAPLVLWVLALGQPRDVLWGRLALATGGLAAIAVISYAIRCGTQPPWLEPVRPLGRNRILAAARLGDLIAVGLVAASGLGMARAFIGPLVLGLAPGSSAALTLFGLVTALGVWPVAARLIERLHQASSDNSWRTLVIPGADFHFLESSARQRRWRRVVIHGASFVTGLVILGVASVPAIGVIGVSATVMLATGLIALFVGGMVLLGQDRRPPELLERLGFKTTPVALLLVTLLLVANLSPASTQLHGLRMLPQDLPDRPSLSQAFAAWLDATDGCGRAVTGGVRWRPLVLYAAEGGGIRAAYWTARGIDVIGGGDPRCASAFLSGGASGGAVGLTVSQVSEPGRAGEAVDGLSRSDALAQASLGMFLRDVLRAGTGLPLTSGTEGWQDRAALIEGAWERDVPALGSPFLANPPGQPGNLVLNSTAVSNGCRTFLSQVALRAGATGRLGDCDGEQAPGGRSVDFFAHDATQRCVQSLRASTAALTASRFPYVTPAAAIGCPGEDLDQLVDGGYVENSGLGTLVDLWPDLWALVRAHNDAAVAGSGQDVVVPLVVYLTNSAGADLAPPGRPITEELLVPPVAYLRAGGAQSSPSALLQRLRGATSGASGGVEGAGLPERRVFVVYPATRASVSAPLGWTLSGMSRAAMDDALTQQEKAPCGDPGVQQERRDPTKASAGLICERGYGTLGDLVGALRG